MRIVVGLDSTASSVSARSMILSTPWPANTEFLLMHAREATAAWAATLPGGAWFGDTDGEARAREELSALDALAAPLRTMAHRVEVQSREGPAALLLRDAAAEVGADLIVVGSRGRGPAAAALLGSVSAELVDHAPCPVLVARQPRVTRILLATDGSGNATRIPTILGRWRAFRRVPIQVLSVAPSPSTDSELMITPWATPAVDFSPGGLGREAASRQQQFVDDMIERLAEGGWQASGVVRFGGAADQIVAEAHRADCDLIITGSRGLGDVRRLLTGSVAHDVLLHSRCSVLVMRGHVPARLEHHAATAVPGVALA